MKMNEIYHPAHLFTFIGRGMILIGLLILSGETLCSQTVSGNIAINILDQIDVTLQPAAVVDNTSTLLYSASNRRVRKITVSATYTNKHYSLFVKAINVPVGHGFAQNAVNLMNITAATDLIRDIPIGAGNATCNLQYTAGATYADGNTNQNGPGNTIVTPTYTQVAQ
jgi:hypothetical protein